MPIMRFVHDHVSEVALADNHMLTLYHASDLEASASTWHCPDEMAKAP